MNAEIIQGTNRYFLSNRISDPTFEMYLRDIGRWNDYLEIREGILPTLFRSMVDSMNLSDRDFVCLNRFEEKYPELCIRSFADVLPVVIHVQFPPSSGAYILQCDVDSVSVFDMKSLTQYLQDALQIEN